MENDLLEILRDMGHKGPLMEETAMKEALDLGHRSVEFTRLVAWISAELREILDLEEEVNPVEDPDDSSHFLLEVSSFLKELQCPHKRFLEGPMNQRFPDSHTRGVMVEFMLTELQATRMVAEADGTLGKPKKLLPDVMVGESEAAANLKAILIALNLPRPPDNVMSVQVFEKARNRLAEILPQMPAESLGEPLFEGALSDKQWHQLDNLCNELFKEYTLRREMLLTRLDVTIQSFKWSEKLKQEAERLQEAYNKQRQYLKPEPDVCLADFLIARKDLAIMEKTSSAAFRRATKSHLNDVVIGAVPDRGGRPSESQPPPAEMPSWQKQRTSGPGGDHRGGRGRGSGRVQNASYNQQGEGGRGSFRGGWSGGRGGAQQTYVPTQAAAGGYNQSYGAQVGHVGGFDANYYSGGSNGGYSGGGGGGGRGRGRGRGRGGY